MSAGGAISIYASAAWAGPVGWICVAVAYAISRLKGNNIHEWLEKCGWGKGEKYKSFDEECKGLQLALAEA